MTADPRFTTRRKLLATSAAVTGLGLAGCVGNGDDADEPAGDDDDHDDDHDDDDHGHDDDDHDHDHDDEVAEEYFDHLGVADEGFQILDRAHDPHEEVAYVHGDHWHGNLPSIPVGDNVSLGAEIELEDGDELELGDEYELRVAEAHDAPEGVVGIDEDDYHGDHVHVHGEEEGVTDVVFLIWHDDHADYQSPPITAQVVEDDDHDHDHDDEYVSEFQLLDRAHDPHEEVSYVHGDHWHGEDEFPTIPVGDNVSIGAELEDADGDEIVLGSEYELGVELPEDAEEGVVEIDEDEDYHGDHVHIHGESAGETEVVFTLIHDDHVDYETPALTVTVGDD